MFAYCGNNPVNRADPSGHFWKEIGDWFKGAGAAIGDFLKGAAEVVVEVAVSVIDTVKDTVIGPILDLGKKISGIFKMEKVKEKAEDNFKIHTKNVINSGADPNYNPEPFVGQKGVSKGYKEYCVQQYEFLLVYTDDIGKMGIRGKLWNDISTDFQDDIVNSMMAWDSETYHAITLGTFAELVEIGIDSVY